MVSEIGNLCSLSVQKVCIGVWCVGGLDISIVFLSLPTLGLILGNKNGKVRIVIIPKISCIYCDFIRFQLATLLKKQEALAIYIKQVL